MVKRLLLIANCVWLVGNILCLAFQVYERAQWVGSISSITETAKLVIDGSYSIDDMKRDYGDSYSLVTPADLKPAFSSQKYADLTKALLSDMPQHLLDKTGNELNEIEKKLLVFSEIYIYEFFAGTGKTMRMIFYSHGHKVHDLSCSLCGGYSE